MYQQVLDCFREWYGCNRESEDDSLQPHPGAELEPDITAASGSRAGA